MARGPAHKKKTAPSNKLRGQVSSTPVAYSCMTKIQARQLTRKGNKGSATIDAMQGQVSITLHRLMLTLTSPQKSKVSKATRQMNNDCPIAPQPQQARRSTRTGKKGSTIPSDARVRYIFIMNWSY